MKQVDEQGLDEFLAEREGDQILPTGTFFQATVTGIRGSFPTYDVQVRRTGESGDGHWHKCAAPGYTPALGDIVDLVKRDDTFSHVIAPLSANAFVSQGLARLAPPIFTTASPASVSFSAIPSSFTHLFCTWKGRSSSGSPTVLNLILNDDTTAANYDSEGQDHIGVTTAAPFQSLGTVGSIRIGALAASTGNLAGGSFYVFDYARTGTAMRRLINFYGWRNDANGTGVEHGAANWRNTTAAVSKLGFSAGAGNLEIFVASLYGI